MKKDLFSILCLALFTILLLIKNAFIKTVIISSCTLFFYHIFPSLFPFMILSDLFLYFHVPEYLSLFLSPFMSKLFSISPYGCYVFFLSCFSGTPTNAYTLTNLVIDKKMSHEEAAHVLSFSFFSNPLFLYSAYSSFLPANIVFPILIIPYLANIIIAFIFRPKSYNKQFSFSKSIPNFGAFFSLSLHKTMNTLVFILGSIVFFAMISSIINPFDFTLVKGILEISQGLYSLNKIPSLFLREVLALLFTSFGGMCIHMQVKGIISEAGISYLPFLKARFCQVGLSITLLLIFHYAFF